jgi:hypothetical protein
VTVAASVAQRTTRHRQRTVTCNGCGETREVTYETFQRIQRGLLSGVCFRCPGPVVVEPTEEHRRYWLNAFGIPDTAIGAGSAADYVRAHGLPGIPDDLLALAASL